MRPGSLRITFTLIFSLLSVSVAFVTLYLLSVIYYTGYSTEVPPIIEGVLSGSLVFSSLGTLLAYRVKRPALAGLIISTVLVIPLGIFFSLSMPTSNLDLFIGTLSSQAFAIFFASMFQSYPRVPGKLIPVVSIAIFTFLSVLIFLATAELYLMLGQAYLPNIVVYMEMLVAVIGSISLLILAKPGKRNKGKVA